MLVHHTLPGVAARNAAKAVSQAGLVCAISGRDRVASWLTIGSVVAGLGARGNGEIFVLALNVDEGDISRLFTAAAIDRIWPSYRSDCRQLPRSNSGRLCWPTNRASQRSISVRPGHYIVTHATPWHPALMLLALLG